MVGAKSLTSAALSLGFTLMVLTFLFLKRSGAHLNPAVSAAVLVSGQRPFAEFNLATGMGYIFVQILASILGALMVSFIIPLEKIAAEEAAACAALEEGDEAAECNRHAMHFLATGSLTESHGISVFTLEFICTFALVWVYFASVVDPRSRAGNLAPFVMGLAMIVGVLAEGPGTGGSMSPARTIAPAVVYGRFKHCVAPVFGSFLGGIFAGMCYNYLFLFGDNDPVPDLYRLTAEPGHHEAEDYKTQRAAELELRDAGKRPLLASPSAARGLPAYV